MNIIRRIYKSCISFLSNHSGLAIILSHGGLHLLVLLLLSVIAVYLYNQTDRNETANLKHIQIESYGGTDYDYDVEFFPSAIFGNIDLDNKDGKCDSLTLGFLFRRIDQIEEIGFEGYETNDSISNAKDLSICFDIKSNYGKANYLNTIDSKEQKSSIKNNHGVLSIESHPIIPVDSLKVWEIPCNFTLLKEINDNKSPNTILFLELNLDFGYTDVSDDFFSVDNRIYSTGGIRVSYGYCGIDKDGKNEYRPFEVKYAYPEPDIVTPFYLEYNNGESIGHIIKNQGVYVILEDIIARNNANRISLQYSILIGAIIAFMLDIIVNLILKWRRLARNRAHPSLNEDDEEKVKLEDKALTQSDDKQQDE